MLLLLAVGPLRAQNASLSHSQKWHFEVLAQRMRTYLRFPSVRAKVEREIGAGRDLSIKTFWAFANTKLCSFLITRAVSIIVKVVLKC